MDLLFLRKKGGSKKGGTSSSGTPVSGRREMVRAEEDPQNIAGPSGVANMGPPQLAGAPVRVPKRRKAGETTTPASGPSAPTPDTPFASRKKRREAPPSPHDEDSEEEEYLPRERILEELDRYSPEHLSSSNIGASAMRTLQALASFRVLPTYVGNEGVPLGRLCPESNRGIKDIACAVSTLQNIAQGEGADARVAILEGQVRDLKAEVRRLKERLTNISRAGDATASQPRAGVSATAAPPAREAPPKKAAAKKAAPQRGQGGPARPGTSAQPSGGAGAVRLPLDSAAEFPPLQNNEEGWREVRRRRKPTAAREEGDRRAPAPTTVPGPKALGGAPKKARRRTAPRKPAVTITTTGERTYASLMKEAREKISLAEYGLEHLELKRARNGGLLFEVPGPDGHEKADNLARALEEVLCGDAVVARPVKRAEMRVLGLDDSTSPQEVVRAMRAIVKRPEADFTVGEIRRSAAGLGVLWVRCPLESALVLADSKYLKVGWTRVRVQLLEDRPLQCYRCLAFGHTAASCGSNRDLKGRCFNCGGVGHVARGCTADPRCPLCVAEGGNPAHRMGGRACMDARGGLAHPSGLKKPRRKKKGGGRRGGGTEGRRAEPAPASSDGRGGAPLPAPPALGRLRASEPRDADEPSTSAAGGPPTRDGGVLPPRVSEDAEGMQLEGSTQYERIPSLEVEFDWEAPENTPYEPSQSN